MKLPTGRVEMPSVGISGMLVDGFGSPNKTPAFTCPVCQSVIYNSNDRTKQIYFRSRKTEDLLSDVLVQA